MSLHLAQFNVGRLRFDQDDPAAAGFMDALDEVNAVRRRTPHSRSLVPRLRRHWSNSTDRLYLAGSMAQKGEL